MQLHMFANTGVETYSLHSHAIQLGMVCKIEYFQSNRRWIGKTTARVFRQQLKSLMNFM
ncbi:unnamed protein product, partial [Onchocerca ochengi]|uniref:Ovule protein n=1 Tax=Onchocerca ochengi TaxID=42157 RepID=A0A182F035_ONCOC